MITIVLPNLKGGGAERVAINLANTWVLWGHHVEFALMERNGEFLEAVDPRITIHNLNCSRIRQVPLRLARYLRKRQPDVTFVHMWPLTSVAIMSWLYAGKPGKIFACEHISLTDHVKRDLSVPLTIVRAVLIVSHRLATGIVAVSEGAANDLAQLALMREAQVVVIPNPVVPANLPPLLRQRDLKARKILWQGQFRYHILSVGSLKPQKNHRLLLHAFAQVADELNAALVILGEGSLRAMLEDCIKKFGLQGRVLLPGFHFDPLPWYQSADLFVLSSDFEGFANVVAEALASGTPVVSTDCPHGPAEILQHGRYGYLVPVGDFKALAVAIRTSLLETHDQHDLRRRARYFSIPRIANRYLAYFRSVGSQV